MRTGTVDFICEHYSHTLRTPLGVALGVLTDLVDGYEVSREELADAKRSLERMLELLNELRDLPRKVTTHGEQDG